MSNCSVANYEGHNTVLNSSNKQKLRCLLCNAFGMKIDQHSLSTKLLISLVINPCKNVADSFPLTL